MQVSARNWLAPALFRHWMALCVATAALLVGASAWADPPGRVGRIAESSGVLWMFDADQGEWIAAKRNRPLTRGDRLSAERDARAELQIGSATLRLDGGSELEITELDDRQVRLHLHQGSLALRLRSNDAAREFAVTTREGRFEPLRAGHYRIDHSDNASFGTAIGGALRFEAKDSALQIEAGQRAEFWSERGVTHYSVAAPSNDRFADWVAQQDRRDQREAGRRPHVSPEMTGAEDLDRYGDWDRHPEYGALWLPRRVEPGWAPYRYGHWAYVRPWGYTWVDDAPWGFAPFHYGRWVSWQGRWAWAPGQYVARPVYAPALVAWIGGPQLSIGINLGGGPAVGWVALSPREAYWPYYSATPRHFDHVNQSHRRWQPAPNQPVRTGPIMYSNQGVPGGVTVVAQDVLRERRPIGNASIAPADPRTIQRWQTQPLVTQAPTMRGEDRRAPVVMPVAPPPPAARVVVVPGGAQPAVPPAPGSVRGAPWGQVPGGQRPAVQAQTGDRDDGREPQRGRPPLSDARGERPAIVEREVIAPAQPVIPGADVRPPRDMQDRRPRPVENSRGEPHRAPPAAAAPSVAPVQPGVTAIAPAPGVAAPAAPPPPPRGQVLPPAAPARIAPPDAANPRGRGPRDADERNEPVPTTPDRRREPRQQQNQ